MPDKPEWCDVGPPVPFVLDRLEEARLLSALAVREGWSRAFALWFRQCAAWWAGWLPKDHPARTESVGPVCTECKGTGARDVPDSRGALGTFTERCTCRVGQLLTQMEQRQVAPGSAG